MEFTFAIENHELQKVFTQKVYADSVPSAWKKMNIIVKPEEATLIHIDSNKIGEILHEYLIASFA